MKKKFDYSLVLWALILGFCAFVSSCSNGDENLMTSKCVTLKGITEIHNLNSMLSPGDTVMVGSGMGEHKVVIISMVKQKK